MHLIMILTALTVAWWLRSSWNGIQGSWRQRWETALFLYLFPPLLLFMTAIAVLCMGPQGKMGGMYTGSISYVLALISLTFFAGLCIKLAWLGLQSVLSCRNFPVLELEGKQVRLLETEILFAGQIGFWQPELVVSLGLLQSLSPLI